MEDHFDYKPKGPFRDLELLIRSVQLLEGNPDCFGKADGHCDREDCLWRNYCLKEK